MGCKDWCSFSGHMNGFSLIWSGDHFDQTRSAASGNQAAVKRGWRGWRPPFENSSTNIVQTKLWSRWWRSPRRFLGFSLHVWKNSYLAGRMLSIFLGFSLRNCKPAFCCCRVTVCDLLVISSRLMQWWLRWGTQSLFWMTPTWTRI